MDHSAPLRPADSVLCPRCETLPEAIEGPGTLYIRFPLSHSAGKLKRVIESLGLKPECHGALITVDIEASDLAAPIDAMRAGLTTVERRDTRVVFQKRGAMLVLADCFAADTLDGFHARLHGRWLVAMLRDQRFTIHFQPIVEAARPDRVHAYECLLRGLDEGGNLVGAGRILDAARSAELLFQVDLAGRRTAIGESVRAGLDDRLFINFTPTSIYDPDYCLNSTVRAVREARIDPSRVVFEVVESEHVPDVDHLRTILDFYRAEGFAIALDDLGSGYSSLNMLSDLQPDYVKLDMGLIRAVDRDPVRGLIARKLIETAGELGIRSIAEGVETAGEHEWLRGNGVDYCQGFHYAKPANPPLL